MCKIELFLLQHGTSTCEKNCLTYSEMTVGGACQRISKYRTCGGFVVEFVAWFVSDA